LGTYSRWTLAVLAACSGGDPSSNYVAHDPCVALAVTQVAPTAMQQSGVGDALALWGDHGVRAFDRGDAAEATQLAGAIEIRFEDAAATFHGLYDPSTNRVLINRAISDRDALAIVVAHELGHAFGLVHIDAATRASLMNPGNLVTPPTEADQHALEALWGACPQAALPASR
jgi:predicted Zn-dependent protease